MKKNMVKIQLISAFIAISTSSCSNWWKFQRVHLRSQRSACRRDKGRVTCKLPPVPCDPYQERSLRSRSHEITMSCEPRIPVISKLGSHSRDKQHSFASYTAGSAHFFVTSENRMKVNNVKKFCGQSFIARVFLNMRIESQHLILLT